MKEETKKLLDRIYFSNEWGLEKIISEDVYNIVMEHDGEFNEEGLNADGFTRGMVAQVLEVAKGPFKEVTAEELYEELGL